MENVVKHIVINKLYDIYDYDIPFDRGGVALITGPNGFGKTTLLEIIKNALSVNFWYFYDLLFQSIDIYLGDDTLLSFKKEKAQKKIVQHSLFGDDVDDFSDEIFFDLKIRHSDKDDKTLDSIILNHRRYVYLSERYSRTIIRRDGNTRYEERVLADWNVLSKSDKDLRMQFGELRLFAKDHPCNFVADQRIFIDKASRYDEDIPQADKYTITFLAKQVKNLYLEQQGYYADKSQLIDSSFIQRQIEKKHESYSKEEYLEKIGRLKQKIANYERFGLIEKYNLVEDYKEELSVPLSMHIDDMYEKFSVYDEFYAKLERFDHFVNGKGLSNKKMILDARNGITFRSESDQVIPLHKLSSGEQNLVILYYRLVFETNNNTLLLVDEPENSMHVEWLQKMLPDYLEMKSNLGCQMIIATHSPTFINGHWDIAYDLYGGSYQDWLES